MSNLSRVIFSNSTVNVFEKFQEVMEANKKFRIVTIEEKNQDNLTSSCPHNIAIKIECKDSFCLCTKKESIDLEHANDSTVHE